MQEIKIYFVLTVIVWLWIDQLHGLCHKPVKEGQLKAEFRNRFFKYIYNHKSFNCGICLSFWTGILVTVLTGEILFLTLPLSFKILNKLL